MALCLAGLAASGGVLPPPAAASIPLGPASSQQSAEAQRAWAASQLGGEAVGLAGSAAIKSENFLEN